MLDACLHALAIKPNGIYVDGTFGRGGHSRAMLRQLGADGRLVAFDRDPAAVAVAQALAAEDPCFQIVHAPFSQLQPALADLGINAVHGILLDLGVSSPQLDEAERGFSFMRDGPLDMRMDTTTGQTAADWLAVVDETTLTEVIKDYGEERFARAIAAKVVATRQTAPITRTGQLADLVADAVRTRERGLHPATRTFQAIRIYLNRELAELEDVLNQAKAVLHPAGRLAVMSFHSLEDRIVKRFMQREANPQGQVDRRLQRLGFVSETQASLRIISTGITADDNELSINPRARSARLRVAEKLSLSV
jgi:16S rRNA (cytosine1402-N4)-methyltransferase